MAQQGKKTAPAPPNRTLTELDVSKCGLTDPGAEALCRALRLVPVTRCLVKGNRLLSQRSTNAIRTRVRVNRAAALLALRTPALESANAEFEHGALAPGAYVELGGSGVHSGELGGGDLGRPVRDLSGAMGGGADVGDDGAARFVAALLPPAPRPGDAAMGRRGSAALAMAGVLAAADTVGGSSSSSSSSSSSATVPGGAVAGGMLGANLTLTALGLRGADLGNDGAVAIASLLSWTDPQHHGTTLRPVTGLPSLTYLNVSQNPFGDKGGEAVAKALSHNRTLTTLVMEANRWKGPACKPFASSLKTNDTLTRLSLAGNSVGNEGAAFLAKALGANKTLTALDLDRASVGALGALRFGVLLGDGTAPRKEKRGAKKAAAAGGEGGEAGGGAAAPGAAKKAPKAAPINRALLSLSLVDNTIGSEAAARLEVALTKNFALTALKLDGKNNRVPPAVAARVTALLRRNDVLNRLHAKDPAQVAVDMSAGAVPVGKEATVLREAGCAVARYPVRGEAVAAAAASKAAAEEEKARAEAAGEPPPPPTEAAAGETDTLPADRLTVAGGERLGVSFAMELVGALRGNAFCTRLDLGGQALGDTGAAALGALLRGTTLAEEAEEKAAAERAAPELKAAAEKAAAEKAEEEAAAALQARRKEMAQQLADGMVAQEDYDEEMAALNAGANAAGARALSPLPPPSEGGGDSRSCSVAPSEAPSELLARGGLPALYHSCDLAVIELGKNDVGPVGGRSLAAGVASSRALVALSLRDNDLGAAGGATAKALGKAVVSNPAPKLAVLNLRFNDLQDAGIVALARALGAEPDAEVWRARAEVEASARAVTRLPPSATADEAAAAAVEAALAALPSPPPAPPPGVATHCSLATLRLEFNDVGDDGARELGVALARGMGAPLRSLCLAGNHVGEAGAEALAQALLAARCSLTFLDLRHNDIGAEGCAALAQSLGARSSPAAVAALAAAGRGEHERKGYRAGAAPAAPGGSSQPVTASDCAEADASTLRTLHVSRNDVGDRGVRRSPRRCAPTARSRRWASATTRWAMTGSRPSTLRCARAQTSCASTCRSCSGKRRSMPRPTRTSPSDVHCTFVLWGLAQRGDGRRWVPQPRVPLGGRRVKHRI